MEKDRDDENLELNNDMIESLSENQSDNSPKVREEVKRLTEKEEKKENKRNNKEKKRNAKLTKKKVRKHKKMLKKNPSNINRYDADMEFGLTNEVVEERILDELVNKTNKKQTKSVGKILYTNIVSFFNILIFFIAGCLIAVKAPITDFAFLLIVLINITIGITQEIRAKKMIESLKLMNASYVTVRRNGQEKEIPVDEVVLDDVLVFSNGNQICTDSIVLDGQVEVNESLLTGESDAIIKKPGDVLLSGSFVVSGKCVARADKVGKDNYIEKLSSQAKVYKKPKSDLLISLNRIIKFMTVPVVLIGGILFTRMFFKLDIVNLDTLNYPIRKTAGAMIGMIPSGLFLMSSIALYVGVIKLGQKNVLVQELYCIEMLARVNCICLDKTGTITDGTMVVKNVIDFENVYGLANGNVISAILNALPDRNMTSEALIDKFGLGKRMDVKSTIPFSSQRKYQAVSFENYGTFVLGAPEFVLGNDFKKYEDEVTKFAQSGYRVLCLAHKEGYIEENILPESSNVVLSLILIEDNIRPDAISTIDYFKNSGVEVRVISGDNPITVSMISQRAGVPNADKYVSLDGMTDQEVKRAALEYTVFGRVSPNQKKIIVQTLKENGCICAMTGDGVNDILALREADCSIALASGSEATRNCSHLVLMDSNFGSMPSVVSEGRRVINNVTGVASLFLTKTIFSLLLGIIAIVRGDYPISAGQLILIDTLAIGLPSLFLVNEPNNNPVSGKFLVNVIRKALPGALTIVILSMIIFMLSESLVLDNITSTTILVIVATHTCLMVLFKTCHPFTPLRKVLCTICYSLFVLAIIVGPQFLEFRPLVKQFEYYSKDTEVSHITDYPRISISKAGMYVIDGKYTTITSFNDQDYDLGAYKGSDGLYYYSIKSGKNRKETDIRVNSAQISYDEYGNILAGGYKINDVKFKNDFTSSLRVDSYGYVYYNNKKLTTTLTKTNTYYNYENKYGLTDPEIVNYCILPTVEIKNGEYIIDGISYGYKVPTDISKKLTTDDVKVSLDANKSMNPELGYDLIVNDSKLTNASDETFKVYLPTISTTGTNKANTNMVYFDSMYSGHNIFTLYGNKIEGTYYTGISDNTETELYYLTDENSNNIYYSKALDSIVTIENDEESDEEYLIISDFKFNNIEKKDFLSYKDTEGNIIKVFGKDSLQIDVSKLYLDAKDNETFYYIYEEGKGELIKTSINLGSSLGPTLTESKESAEGNDYYVINGYITEYQYKGADLNPKMNKHNYLVIGGITTDYKLIENVNYVTVEGTNIRVLGIEKLIFLFMLMLLSYPLMRLLQYSIPWIRKQLDNLQKFLNKC